MYICKCGHIGGCLMEAFLHVAIDHLHQDMNVPKDVVSDEGNSCLSCLLADTIPLIEYYKSMIRRELYGRD